MPTRHQVWVKNKIDTFRFSAPSKPDLINFDADKILVGQKTENKTLAEYLFQYKHARNYIDRREAIDAALKKQAEVQGVEILQLAANDPFGPLRAYSINALDLSAGQIKNAMEPLLAERAKQDPFRLAKSAAIAKLGQYKMAKYIPLFQAAVNDSSYSVAGSALEALNNVDSAAAAREAKRLSALPAKGKLANVLKNMESAANPAAAIAILEKFEAMPVGQAKYQALESIFELIEKTRSMDIFKRGVDNIMALGAASPESFRDQVVTALNTALRELQKQKSSDGLKEQADYIDSKLPKDDKKGF